MGSAEVKAGMTWRLIKAVFVLLVLGLLALIGYAYFGPVFMPQDFAPPVSTVTEPVNLPVGGG